MQKALKIEISADEAAQVQAEIEHLFTEMRAANEQMQRDREEIERLKKRTRKTLGEIEQLLSRKAA